ncbi:MAG: hypothetical protein P8Y71_30445, partial [Pseudolabrys sp.]
MILFLCMGGVVGVVVAAVARRTNFKNILSTAGGLGFVLFLMFVPMEFFLGFRNIAPAAGIIWLGFMLTGWGLSIGWVLRGAYYYRAHAHETLEAEQGPSRRRFLYLSATGIVALIASAFGIGILALKRKTPAAGMATAPRPDLTSGPAKSPSIRSLEGRIQPAPGTRAEITATEDFYRVDIDAVPPEIDAAAWHLEIDGLVSRPLTLA